VSLTIGITGANGYVGSRLRATLTAAGHRGVSLVRRPVEGQRYFSLGQPIAPQALEDIDVLVHCAWDMRSSNPTTVQALNVDGSAALLTAAHEARVRRIIFISSMSSFEGCRSVYGQAKYAVEQIVTRAGGISVRPGLIYGPEPGGMVGALLKLAQQTPVLPMVGTGQFKLHTCHEEDLTELLLIICMSSAVALQPVITAAENQGQPFSKIISLLAQRKLLYIPVPWRLIWVGIKALEALSINSRFKSDSLIGLVHSDPNPDFSSLKAMRATFRQLAVASKQA